MIWASDSQGRTTYVSPEWLVLTGQSRAEAEGLGWLEVTHPADREIVLAVVEEANRAAADFTITFRLRRRNGDFVWMVGGAMPSFSPQDGRFLGFLGSISEAPKLAASKAHGRVGHYRPLPPSPLTQPHSVLDLIADHLLMARALAAEAGEEMLRSIIDMSLLEAGQRLARCHRERNSSALN
ncbi:PAS domain-containing protein [Enterovirga aerilata]|uniref:histidine kinase n=1 Tax=Enterovirga aerilata TaxID=2730920 RepID=A0A849IBP6_9HYPH|nr:PAS domain-containing protein [Enterovirga sp. DB1703]NNM73397.1 PAS domain-containing protein [Enterovirga sp. DB1703]